MDKYNTGDGAVIMSFELLKPVARQSQLPKADFYGLALIREKKGYTLTREWGKYAKTNLRTMSSTYPRYADAKAQVDELIRTRQDNGYKVIYKRDMSWNSDYHKE